MSKHILVGKKALVAMMAGVSKLAEIIGKTLGADGKHIFVEHPSAKIPLSTKDGATVATWTQFEDKFENLGAGVVKYAAQKTALEAGDGTTTTTILANELIQQGYNAIQQGAKAREICNGYRAASANAVSYVNKVAKEIEHNGDMVKKVSMVSSNYDVEISSMITDAVKKIGKQGVISVEKNLGGGTSLEFNDGVTVQSGYSHQVFVNTRHNECVLENVAIVLCDYELSKISEIGVIFSAIEANEGQRKPKGITRPRKKESDPISHHKVDSYLFIAKDVIGEALSSLAKTKSDHDGPVAVARAPIGDDFNVMIRDLATVTGGKVVAESEGATMETQNPHEVCGYAKKIILTNERLTIIGGATDPEKFSNRVMTLNQLIDAEEDHKERDILRKRLARLTGSVATLAVGGDNDAHIQERKDRADDAVHAVRSALEEGVVTGGGITYILAAMHAKNSAKLPQGEEILIEALSSPIKKLLENSGVSELEPEILAECVQDSQIGYNALTDKIENIYESGIVDPAKVVRCAIENAVQVATQLLNTGAAMYFLPEDDNRKA